MLSWIPSAIKTVELTIRRYLTYSFSFDRKLSDEEMDSLLDNCSDRPIGYLLSNAFLANFESNIANGIEDHPDPESENFSFESYFESAIVLQEMTDSTPLVRSHLSLLKRVLNLIDSTKSSANKRITEHQFHAKLILALIRYGQRCDDDYDEHIDDLAKGIEYMRDSYTYWDPSSSDAYPGADDDDDTCLEHSAILTRIVDALKSTSVSKKVAYLVLSRSIATLGLFSLGSHDFPFLTHVFPQSWLDANADDIWIHRHKQIFPNDPNVLDPEFSLPDWSADYISDLQECFRAIVFSKLPTKIENVANTFKDSSDEPEDIEPPLVSVSPTAALSVFNLTSHGNFPKQLQASPIATRTPTPSASVLQDKIETSNTAIPTTEQPPVDFVPDDSTYVPDACLSRKVRHLTSYFQDFDIPTSNHDHMTRFDTIMEHAIPLSRFQVQRTDSRTFSGPSILSRMYVVTYTRKSRKPIFNPVD